VSREELIRQVTADRRLTAAERTELLNFAESRRLVVVA